MYRQKIDRLKMLSGALLELVKADKTAYRNVENALKRLDKLELNLMLLGQFKRGKSTLANCFIGKKVMPTSTVPLTAVATEVRFGENERMTVVFKNGDEISKLITKIAEYVTEEGNPKNRKAVDHVNIYCKADFLKDGLVLIDTPGIGSTFLHNTRATRDYLPNCDAALLLISADSPLSVEETEFIKSIKRYAPKIFFVLNKCDFYSKKEIDKMKEHIENELKRLGLEVSLIPISARLGLEGKINNNKQLLKESGLDALELTLKEFLYKNKNDVLLEAVRLKIYSVSESLYNNIGSQYAALDLDTKDLQGRSLEFHKQLENIKHLATMYPNTIEPELSGVMAVIDKDISAARQELTTAIYLEVKAELENARGTKENPIDQANKLIKFVVEAKLGKWWKTEDRKIKGDVESIQERYNGMANEANLRLAKISNKMFDFKPKTISRTCSIDMPTDFSFGIQAFGTEFMFVPRLNNILPPGMLRKKLLRELEEKIYEVVDMNLGRIRYDYLQRLEKGGERFAKYLLKDITKLQKEIETGLEKGSSLAGKTMEEKKRAKTELNRQLKIALRIMREAARK